MNNIALYISITATVLAFILAIPKIIKTFLAFSLRQALKSRERISKQREAANQAREEAIRQIAICEAFESNGITQATEIKEEAAAILAKCNQLIVILDNQDEQNNGAITALQAYFKQQ
jgi:hypothetical protein